MLENWQIAQERSTATGSASIKGQLRELRQFVERGISDLRSQLNREAALAKAELQKHLSGVRMTPTKDREDWHYVAEGNWDLLGTGPNAPALGLAHSDGCGGPQCTEPACLVLPFRIELVQVAA